MANQQAIDYIGQRTAEGAGREQITNELKASGWRDVDITGAFAATDSGVHTAPTPSGQALPGAVALMSEAWALFTDRITTFLGIMLVPVLVVALGLGGFVAFGYFGPELISKGGIVLPLILGSVFIIALALIQSWSQIALLFAVKDSTERIGFSEAYKRGWKLFLSYWWVSILIGCIVLGGFILLVVPGIIFAIWFSLSLFVLVGENERGMNALLKSREYVRGNWGKVFWRFICITIVSILVSLVLGFVLSMVPYGDVIAQVVISLFLTPFTLIYLFLIYRYLRAQKGQVTLPANGGKRGVFIAMGIVGCLVIPLLIFTSIVLASLNSARTKVNDARRQADLRSIQVQLELYEDRTGAYPETLADITDNEIPKDPETGESYEYTRNGAGGYALCADLETREDVCYSDKN